MIRRNRRRYAVLPAAGFFFGGYFVCASPVGDDASIIPLPVDDMALRIVPLPAEDIPQFFRNPLVSPPAPMV